MKSPQVYTASYFCRKTLKRDKTRISARKKNTKQFNARGEKEEVITINFTVIYSSIIIIYITHQRKIVLRDKSFVENNSYEIWDFICNRKTSSWNSLILEQDVETDKHLMNKVDPLSEKLNVSTVPSLLQLYGN